MAIQNKGQIGTAVTSLISAIATSFPNNTTKLITPAILRNWLTSLTAILTSVNDSENNVGEIYTKAAAETKRAAGGLTPNQFYFISNATGAGTKVIAILASAANAFHTSAINLTDGSFGSYVLGADVFTAVGGGATRFGVSGEDVLATASRQFNLADNSLQIMGTSVIDPTYSAITFIQCNDPDDAGALTISNSISGPGGLETLNRITRNGATVGATNGGNSASLDIDTAGNLILSSTGTIKVISATGAFPGLQEADNYSANYTALSLVNKGYVQSIAFTKTGQNSITVQSVNTGVPATDAITNGTNLLAALAAVNALDWGIRLDRNRGAVNLLPGTYDTNVDTIQMFPFIDIVGISTDRKATIIMGSGMTASQRHIDFNTSNAGLHNLTLIANVANDAIMLGGDAGCFPICENVYFGSNNIFRGTAIGFFDLDGRFNNCEFRSGFTYSFFADNNITATISNSIIYGVVSCVSFTGKLINCDINTVGIIQDSIAKIATGAVIERCNILSETLRLTLFSNGAPISISCSFSTFNNVWDPAIINSLSTIPALDKMGLRDAQNVLIGVPAYGSFARGTTTFAAVLATTTYTITHGLPFTPSLVTKEAQNSSAASAMSFTSNYTPTTFDITFLAVPTGNPLFGFVAYNITP